MVKFNKDWEKQLARGIDSELQKLGTYKNNKELFDRAKREADGQQTSQEKSKSFEETFRKSKVEPNKELIKKFFEEG